MLQAVYGDAHEQTHPPIRLSDQFDPGNAWRPLEGIATNILADRLKKLVAAGLLSTSADPAHKQKTIYSLTEPAIQLVPLLAQMGAWRRRYTPATRGLSIRAQLLEDGGPEMWEAFMAELCSLHLGAEPPQRSVIKVLTDAYLAEVG